MKQQTIKIMQHFFRHFASRLSERYNVLITFEEYVELCKLPFIRGQRLKTNGEKSFHKGNVEIQGIRVNVYRGVHGIRPFLTALPINKKSKL